MPTNLLNDYDELSEFVNKYNIEDKKILYDFIIKTKQYEKELVDLVMCNLYDYVNKPTEIKDKRDKQTLFRNDLVNKYKRCIISNYNELTCQACHIIPYCDSDDSMQYNLDNGILLNSELHILFDKYLWSINSDQIVKFSDIILNNIEFERFHQYHNKKLNILNTNTLNNLEKHYNIFIIKTVA